MRYFLAIILALAMPAFGQLEIPAGKTSKSIPVFLQDASGSGTLSVQGLASLAYNTSGLTAYYVRSSTNGSPTAISLATLATATSSFSSGGFVEIDGVHMKGLYRLDVPDAILASGAEQATIYIYGATNLMPRAITIELTANSNQVAVAPSNLVQVDGGTLTTHATGMPPVDVRDIGGATVSTSTAQLGVNAVNIGGAAVAGGSVPNAVAGAPGGLATQDSLPVSITGTASAGGNTTITLASATGVFKGAMIHLISATGSGQARTIVSLASTTATVDRAWETNPANGTGYRILSGENPSLGSSLLTLSDAINIGGTAQTGRDIGASVLISSGTGAGQLDVTSGVIKANLAQILGTAITETAGQIAAGFKKVFDVGSPVFTAASVNQGGDAYTRLGAPSGASIDADILTRLATSGYTTPPTAAAIRAEIDSNSTQLVAIKTKTDQLTFTLANKIDANAQAIGGTTQTGLDLGGNWTAARALKIDFLTGDAFARLGAPSGASIDADILTRLATSGYTTPPTSAAIVTAMMTDLLNSTDFNTAASFGKLLKDDIDAAISSRLSATAGTPPTAAEIARETWRTLTGSDAFTLDGSIGKSLKAAEHIP